MPAMSVTSVGRCASTSSSMRARIPLAVSAAMTELMTDGAQHRYVGSEHRVSAAAHVVAVEVRSPQVAGGVERAAVAAAAPQVVEHFGRAERLVVGGERVAQNLLRLRFDHVQKLPLRI